MSYRYAWGLIRKAEEKLGEPLLSAHKGGKSGGGGAELTERGEYFLVEFQRLRDQMARASEAGPERIISGVVKEVKISNGEVEVVLRVGVSDKVRFRKGQSLSIQL
jgi:molybdate transport repressor ModE-like protein